MIAIIFRFWKIKFEREARKQKRVQHAESFVGETLSTELTVTSSADRYALLNIDREHAFYIVFFFFFNKLQNKFYG